MLKKTLTKINKLSRWSKAALFLLAASILVISLFISQSVFKKPASESAAYDQALTEKMDVLFVSENPALANEVKQILLGEATAGKFTDPVNSYKFAQNQAMQRGVYYLYLAENYQQLFNEQQKNIIRQWFVKITKRAFTIEWSDFYYAIAFQKPLTAPYRNQENGVAALAVYAQIIKDVEPELAAKAANYAEKNAILWRNNFKNADDSITYQKIWIYNAYYFSKYLQPELLSNENSKKSFEHLLLQWPNDCSALGYNPDSDVLIYDVLYLSAYLHNSAELRWLADCNYNYAKEKNLKLQGFMPEFHPGLQFMDYSLNNTIKVNNLSTILSIKPQTGSAYIKAASGLTQFPNYDMPDKIVFRAGWNKDDFYALLNLRFDAWHSYKAPNAFITLRKGSTFIAEDIVKSERSWLPKGRAIVRDENIGRERLNGFYIKEKLLNRFFSMFDIFKFKFFESMPKYATVIDFADTEHIDYAKTELAWKDWKNTRTSILFKNDFFAVIDKNSGKNPQEHSIIWHTAGNLTQKPNDSDTILLENNGNYLAVRFLFNQKTSLSIKDSKEDAEPYSKLFPINNDLYLSSGEKNSKIITLFLPTERDILDKFNVAQITDSCIGIESGNTNYWLLVNDGRSNLDNTDKINKASCNGITTDAMISVLENSNNNFVFYYANATYIEFAGKNYSLIDRSGKMTIT